VQERREIEAALHDGDLWAVAATNALELGVDVGSLDVTLHLGFPGMLLAFPSYCPAAFAAYYSAAFLALTSPSTWASLVCLLPFPGVLTAISSTMFACRICGVSVAASRQGRAQGTALHLHLHCV
jgi:hypothetical protein